MRKWFQVSLVVELVALLASGAVVAWFLFAGGDGASWRAQLVCDMSINVFAACLLAVAIEFLAVRHSEREETAKIVRNDDLATYYAGRFAKFYFEMTVADKDALAAAKRSADFAKDAGAGAIRNREIPVAALPNLFKPSDFVGTFYSKMLVEEFFDNEAKLIDCFRRNITAMDYAFHDEVRSAMIDFVKAAAELACAAEIRNSLHRKLGGRRMTEILAEWFADGTFQSFRDECAAGSRPGDGNPMLPYVVFLERLKRERDTLVAYQDAISRLRASIGKQPPLGSKSKASV